MTFQLYELLEHATEQAPEDVGLADVEDRFTFVEMLRVSHGLADRIRDFGVRPRDVVATFLPPFDDWLTTLAISHGAAISVSLWGVGAVNSLHLNWLVSHTPHPAVPPERTIIINRGTIQSLRDYPHRLPRMLFARGDKSVRHVLTSGTTGTPKTVDYTPDLIEHRITNLASYWTNHRSEVNFMGLSSSGGFFTALSCLIHRTPYVALERINRDSLQFIADLELEVIAGSPNQVGLSLDTATKESISFPAVTEIRLAGATPGPTLLNRLHERFNVPIRNVYGSTEGGGVTSILHTPDAPAALENTGPAVSGMNLEIVDADGAPVPTGRVGQVRYRSKGLSPGYISATSGGNAFRDGWFYPGDKGHLDDDGNLILHGRTDDLLNVGGGKIDPVLIEERALSFPGILDAGAFSIERTPGLIEVGIAVVSSPDVDLRALDKALRSALPTAHPTVYGIVQAIPRNRMGKIMRADLLAEVRRQLARMTPPE